MVVLADATSIEVNIQNLSSKESVRVTVDRPSNPADFLVFIEGKGPLAIDRFFILPLEILNGARA